MPVDRARRNLKLEDETCNSEPNTTHPLTIREMPDDAAFETLLRANLRLPVQKSLGFPDISPGFFHVGGTGRALVNHGPPGVGPST
jgi:hypothetical protein